MNSDRGAVQQTLDFLSEDGPTRLAELLRPESTDPARNDQPALMLAFARTSPPPRVHRIVRRS